MRGAEQIVTRECPDKVAHVGSSGYLDSWIGHDPVSVVRLARVRAGCEDRL